MLTEKEFILALGQNQNIIYKVCNLYMHKASGREDLFQEIVLNAWKGISTFKGEAKFSTWLYRVALNTAITFFRKEKGKPGITLLPESLANIADTVYRQDEQLNAMYKAIAELSNIDKALVMLYLDDYSYQEMSDMMGITSNNIAVKMSRIKTKLKESSKKYL